MTHSWQGNLAQFGAESVAFSDGFLHLTLLDAPSGVIVDGETKTFLGAELRSVATVTYGKIRTRARFAKGSAVVSALVSIYTPWPADNWNELDIECLGAHPSEVQFNTMVYTGDLPAAETPVAPTQFPQLRSLGFDSSVDFHVYEIEWTPDSVVFLVDDAVVYEWNSRIDLMTLPQNILLTIWASGSPDWAGSVNATTSGAVASYDWLELYQYNE
jgi:beta-glucanase (GH16 family)